MILGICGVSGSGKTTLANKLAEKLNCEILHLDNFYKESFSNFDSPEAIDFAKYIKAIKGFKGKTVIVEGFLIFSNSELLKLIDKKFYLDISLEEMLRRRKLRIDREQDDKYIKEIFIPLSQEYRYRQLSASDIILDGRLPIETNLTILVKDLNV